MTVWDVGRARDVAEEHLADALPGRWAHVQGVAGRAREVTVALDSHEAEVLVAAAWLHDIGYAPVLQRTGAHQLDGAALLQLAGQERLAALVAHHSESRFELGLVGLEEELAAYADEDSAVSQALTYCDLTIGPDGFPVEPWERLDEIRERYGDEHVYVRAQELALPSLYLALAHTEMRLYTPYQPDLQQQSRIDKLTQSLEVLSSRRNQGG